MEDYDSAAQIKELETRIEQLLSENQALRAELHRKEEHIQDITKQLHDANSKLAKIRKSSAIRKELLKSTLQQSSLLMQSAEVETESEIEAKPIATTNTNHFPASEIDFVEIETNNPQRSTSPQSERESNQLLSNTDSPAEPSAVDVRETVKSKPRLSVSIDEPDTVTAGSEPIVDGSFGESDSSHPSPLHRSITITDVVSLLNSVLYNDSLSDQRELLQMCCQLTFSAAVTALEPVFTDINITATSESSAASLSSFNEIATCILACLRATIGDSVENGTDAVIREKLALVFAAGALHFFMEREYNDSSDGEPLVEILSPELSRQYNSQYLRELSVYDSESSMAVLKAFDFLLCCQLAVSFHHRTKYSEPLNTLFAVIQQQQQQDIEDHRHRLQQSIGEYYRSSDELYRIFETMSERIRDIHRSLDSIDSLLDILHEKEQQTEPSVTFSNRHPDWYQSLLSNELQRKQFAAFCDTTATELLSAVRHLLLLRDVGLLHVDEDMISFQELFSNYDAIEAAISELLELFVLHRCRVMCVTILSCAVYFYAITNSPFEHGCALLLASFVISPQFEFLSTELADNSKRLHPFSTYRNRLRVLIPNLVSALIQASEETLIRSLFAPFDQQQQQSTEITEPTLTHSKKQIHQWKLTSSVLIHAIECFNESGHAALWERLRSALLRLVNDQPALKSHLTTHYPIIDNQKETSIAMITVGEECRDVLKSFQQLMDEISDVYSMTSFYRYYMVTEFGIDKRHSQYVKNSVVCEQRSDNETAEETDTVNEIRGSVYRIDGTLPFDFFVAWLQQQFPDTVIATPKHKQPAVLLPKVVDVIPVIQESIFEQATTNRTPSDNNESAAADINEQTHDSDSALIDSVLQLCDNFVCFTKSDDQLPKRNRNDVANTNSESEATDTEATDAGTPLSSAMSRVRSRHSFADMLSFVASNESIASTTSLDSVRSTANQNNASESTATTQQQLQSVTAEEQRLKVGQEAIVGGQCVRHRIRTTFELPSFAQRSTVIYDATDVLYGSELTSEVDANTDWILSSSVLLNQQLSQCRKSNEWLERFSSLLHTSKDSIASVLFNSSLAEAKSDNGKENDDCCSLSNRLAVALWKIWKMCCSFGCSLDEWLSNTFTRNFGLQRAKKLIAEYNTRRDWKFRKRKAELRRQWIRAKNRASAAGQPIPEERSTDINRLVPPNASVERLKRAVERSEKLINESCECYRTIVDQLQSVHSTLLELQQQQQQQQQQSGGENLTNDVRVVYLDQLQLQSSVDANLNRTGSTNSSLNSSWHLPMADFADNPELFFDELERSNGEIDICNFLAVVHSQLCKTPILTFGDVNDSDLLSKNASMGSPQSPMNAPMEQRFRLPFLRFHSLSPQRLKRKPLYEDTSVSAEAEPSSSTALSHSMPSPSMKSLQRQTANSSSRATTTTKKKSNTIT